MAALTAHAAQTDRVVLQTNTTRSVVHAYVGATINFCGSVCRVVDDTSSQLRWCHSSPSCRAAHVFAYLDGHRRPGADGYQREGCTTVLVKGQNGADRPTGGKSTDVLE